VTTDGRVKILDFGIAKLVTVGPENEDSEAPTRSVTSERGARGRSTFIGSARTVRATRSSWRLRKATYTPRIGRRTDSMSRTRAPKSPVSGCSRWKASKRRLSLWRQAHVMKEGLHSHRTASSSLINRTRPGATRSTGGRFRRRGASGRCRRVVAAVHDGAPMVERPCT